MVLLGNVQRLSACKSSSHCMQTSTVSFSTQLLSLQATGGSQTNHRCPPRSQPHPPGPSLLSANAGFVGTRVNDNDDIMVGKLVMLHGGQMLCNLYFRGCIDGTDDDEMMMR